MATLRMGTAYFIIGAILILVILDSFIAAFLPIILPDIDWSLFSFVEWLLGVIKAGIKFVQQLIHVIFCLVGVMATVEPPSKGVDEIIKLLQLALDLVVATIGVFIELAALSLTTIMLSWVFGGSGDKPDPEFRRG